MELPLGNALVVASRRSDAVGEALSAPNGGDGVGVGESDKVGSTLALPPLPARPLPVAAVKGVSVTLPVGIACVAV